MVPFAVLALQIFRAIGSRTAIQQVSPWTRTISFSPNPLLYLISFAFGNPLSAGRSKQRGRP